MTLPAWAVRYTFFHGHNLAIRHRNIHDAIDPIGGINNVPAFQQQVVMHCLRHGERSDAEDQCEDSGHSDD